MFGHTLKSGRHEVIVQVEKLQNKAIMTLVTARGYLLLLLAFLGSTFVTAAPSTKREGQGFRRPPITRKDSDFVKYFPRRRFARNLLHQDLFEIPSRAWVDLHRQLLAHERNPRSLQSFGRSWSEVTEDTVHPVTVTTATDENYFDADANEIGGKNKNTSHEPGTRTNLERESVSTRLIEPQQRPTTSAPSGRGASSSEEPARFVTSSSRTDIKADENLDYAESDSHVGNVTYQASSAPSRPGFTRNESDPVLATFLSLLGQIDPKHNISVAEARRILWEARRGRMSRFLSHLGRHNHHVKRGAPQRNNPVLSLQDIFDSFPITTPSIEGNVRRHQLPASPPSLSAHGGAALVLPPESIKGGLQREQTRTIYHDDSGLTLRMLPDGSVGFVQEADIDVYCKCILIPC